MVSLQCSFEPWVGHWLDCNRFVMSVFFLSYFTLLFYLLGLPCINLVRPSFLAIPAIIFARSSNFSCASLWSYSIPRTPFARAYCLAGAPAGAPVRVTSSRREKEKMEKGTQVGLFNWLQRRRQ